MLCIFEEKKVIVKVLGFFKYRPVLCISGVNCNARKYQQINLITLLTFCSGCPHCYDVPVASSSSLRNANTT